MLIDYKKLRGVTGVYKIFHRASKKCYIGSSSKCIYQRLRGHLSDLRKNIHHSKHLQRAWNKYGESEFLCHVLEECLPNNCILREQHWMNHFKSFNRQSGYNHNPCAGSNRGVVRTKEQREEMSRILRGRKLPEAHKNNIAAAGLGRVFSKESREKKSASLKAWNKINIFNWTGKKHTQATIEKMRASRLRNLAKQHGEQKTLWD